MTPTESARATCAHRLRERGHPEEAARFEAGERDGSWAMRHQVLKMENEDASNSR